MENEHRVISTIEYVLHVCLVNPNPTVVELSKSDYCRAQRFDRHFRIGRCSVTIQINVFSCIRNSSWSSLLCDYQMNDIRLGYTNLQDVLDGKRTTRYKSISDILISIFFRA